MTTTYPGDWSGSINGLAFGPGTPFEVISLSGWRDQESKPLGGVMTGSAASNLPAPKGFSNGSWDVDYWMDKREPKLVLAVVYDGTDWETLIESIENATAPTGAGTASMSVEIGGISTTVTGSVSSRILPTELEYQFGLARVSIGFTAFDPRRMWAPLSASTGLPQSSGGLTVPFTVPFTIAATQTSGQVVLTNPGSVTGPLTVQIFGGPSGVTGPVLTHQETGLSVAFPSTFTVAAGDSITVDMEAQTALYNGTASRPVLTPGWFGFVPGVNIIGFSAVSYSAGASITVTATPASI